MADRPLSDLLVLDLTRALSGPIASRLLADLGADVIKIEPPDGDLTRSIVPRVGGMAVYYAQYNAGKRCVSIDLATPAGRDLLLAMVDKADIVLENYRPGVMARLGLSYEAMATRNPHIIVASISGWGHDNSRSGRGAYASVIHAETGVTEMVARRRGTPDEPRNDPMPHADVYGGLHALAALLAAVHMRDRTGRGQAVEVSMAESTLMANDLASIELSGVEPEVGFRAGQNWSPVFRLANGRHVSITLDGATDAGYAVWCAAFPQAEWAADPRFATTEGRVEQRAALEAGIGRWVARLDSPEALVAVIGRTDLMVADVSTVPELAASAWAAERGAFVVVPVGAGDEVVVPQAPWRFSHADSGVIPTLGFRGEHNREVLRELLGLTDERIDALVADGVLSDRVPEWRRAPRA